MKTFKIKVCGMRNAQNVAEVAQLHPAYMGFIFYPKSPRYVSEISAELIKYVPDEIKTTGVFVDEDLAFVKLKIAQHQLKAVQLHGNESPEYCQVLKGREVEVIKAFGVGEGFDFTQLNDYKDVIDYFLFDTQTVSHGGSGKTFDWRLLENYELPKPYFLSGGIGLEHVEALKNISDERLYAVDVNSKFEIEPALKDVDLLKAFFEGLKG